MPATKTRPAPISVGVPRVYSYLRFSTPEQQLGDSERRQVDGARKYADDKGLSFDESLSDKGISAFRGKNRKSGALAGFLARVHAGEIPAGSILVVENTDRLSREDFLTAFDTISSIIRAGITIHTMSPEIDYNLASLNGGQIHFLVAQIQLAHQESLKKSERITAARCSAREKARGEKRVLTKMVPAWLKVEGEKQDKKIVVIPEAVETVRKIFDLKIQGMSKNRIAPILNADKSAWQPPGRRGSKGWHYSYVAKILSNLAVLGEYQPHIKRDGKRYPEGEPIQDYFPRIIDNETFFAAQTKLSENRNKGGRTGKGSNLFTHLAKCPYCGSSMQFMDKGKPPKGFKYLVCYNNKNGKGCPVKTTARYEEAERTILEFCHKLKPEQVLPNRSEQEKLCRSLRTRISGKSAEKSDLESQIDNLVDQISRTASQTSRDRYQARIVKLEETSEAIGVELIALGRELKQAEKNQESLTNWQASLAELQSALGENDPTLRHRTNAHLREFIDRIEFFTIGYPENSDTFGEYLEGGIDNELEEIYSNKKRRKEWQKFVAYCLSRRATKEARFYRIHWRTRGHVDAVPAGSLASGLKIASDGVTIIEPSITKLWQEFQKAERSKQTQ